jgi:uncharacterized protein (TIGR00255 family)
MRRNRNVAAMIQSMTAFARIERAIGEDALAWELRSVNHRFLDVQFRLPESLREIESPLRELVRGRLKRGKVDCTLRVTTPAQLGAMEVDKAALRRLLATIETLRREVAGLAAPEALDLLRWPGVLVDRNADVDALRSAATESFADALALLARERRREGAALEALVASRLDDIESLARTIAARIVGHADSARARLLARLSELTVTLDKARLEQEVALLVQRSDVAEELDRLRIHVATARTDLGDEGPHGRRLDFVMQELNREANTIASKTTQPEVTRDTVDLKVLIEQIREQVQNIE